MTLQRRLLVLMYCAAWRSGDVGSEALWMRRAARANRCKLGRES